MGNAYGNHDVEDSEDLILGELMAGDQPVGWYGVGATTGDVYVNGDLHPRGSANAMVEARLTDVPYVPVSAVRVLFPLDWIRAACLHDRDRLMVLANLERFAREHAKEK